MSRDLNLQIPSFRLAHKACKHTSTLSAIVSSVKTATLWTKKPVLSDAISDDALAVQNHKHNAHTRQRILHGYIFTRRPRLGVRLNGDADAPRALGLAPRTDSHVVPALVGRVVVAAIALGAAVIAKPGQRGRA
jgi:hypothetical protein